MRKDAFFKKLDLLAVTFDDVDLKKMEVSLATDYSEIMPADVSTKTLFSTHLPLNMPIVGAAMEFMGHELAIQLALQGGIGVIPRSFTPEEQAREVVKVKYHFNGLIVNPITVGPEETMEEVRKHNEEKGYSFHSFPVVKNKKLVGFLTQNHFKFCSDYSMRVRDVMAKNVLSAPEGTSIDDAFRLMQKREKGALPLVNKDYDLTGLYLYNDLKRIKAGPSMNNTDARGQLVVAAAIGVGRDELDRAAKLVAKNVNALVIDAAHADTKSVHRMGQEVKGTFPHIDLVVGNVTNPRSVVRLAKLGVFDCIKPGQGSGSICTTRIVAGIGCPQVTAIAQCEEAAREFGIPICADGGIRYSGDIVKALAAGARSVMIGSLFAGTKEALGKKIRYKGQWYKAYRGMGSLGAMQERKSSRERYRQKEDAKNIPEGVEGRVAFAGDAAEVITQLVGGVRLGMAYIGAKTIEALQKRAEFYLISAGGIAEAPPHNVIITEEAPNYHRE